MFVVILQDEFYALEFCMTNGLKHILGIDCIIEKRAALACRTLLSETGNITHKERSY
jgi:hypothetical protein